MSKATQQAKAEHGDMVTIDLNTESSSKLIALLKENGIPAKIVHIKGDDRKDFPHQVLVPAKYAMQFCEIADRIANEQDFCELDTFQGEFLTAVYDSKIDKLVDMWKTVHGLPTAEDLVDYDISDPNADVHTCEIESVYKIE